MTYNFDPDRWYEDERVRLDMRRRSGEIGEREAEEALKEIERRYEEMLKRLDRTFDLGHRPT
jgi:hypothetical protein